MTFEATVTRSASTYVLVVGPHSSGKSTFANELAAVNDGTVVEMGDVVRDEARLQSRPSLVELAADLMDSDRLHIATRVARKALAAGPGLVVVVGPRTRDEFIYLCHELPSVLTVGMTVSTDLRRVRWAERSIGFSDTWESREAAGTTLGYQRPCRDVRVDSRRLEEPDGKRKRRRALARQRHLTTAETGTRGRRTLVYFLVTLVATLAGVALTLWAVTLSAGKIDFSAQMLSIGTSVLASGLVGLLLAVQRLVDDKDQSRAELVTLTAVNGLAVTLQAVSGELVATRAELGRSILIQDSAKLGRSPTCRSARSSGARSGIRLTRVTRDRQSRSMSPD